MQDPTTEEVTLVQLQQQVNTLRQQRNAPLHNKDTDNIAFTNADDFSDLESVDDEDQQQMQPSTAEQMKKIGRESPSRQWLVELIRYHSPALTNSSLPKSLQKNSSL
jgi:hypothetical protein